LAEDADAVVIFIRARLRPASTASFIS
jgi:hypothetical protein